MQLAYQADPPAFDLAPGRPRSTRRSTKFMVAGVAMASAGVIAVSPVTPALPDLQERAAHAAVALTAATNPLIVWQETITATMESLQTLGVGISESVPALLGAISNPEIYLELVNIIAQNTLNPIPLLTEIVNFPTNYGGVIDTALTDTIEHLTNTVMKFPTVLINTLRYLAEGQFVEAFAEADVYFVLDFLGALRPMIPLFSIPSDFLASLPGAERLPALLDVVSEFAVTKAAIAPFLTAVAQTAEIFDATRIALTAGDFQSAAIELVNLPAKVLNAFVNGYTPGFATGAWPGLINGGIVDYLTVTLPNQIAAALTGPVATATTTGAQGSPSDFSLSNDTVLVDVVSQKGLSGTNGSGDGGAIGTGDDDETGVSDDDAIDEDVTEEDVTKEDVIGEDDTSEEEVTGDENVTEEDITDEDEDATDTDDDASDTDDDTTGDDGAAGGDDDAGAGSGSGAGAGSGGSGVGSGSGAGAGSGGSGAGSGTGDGSGSGSGGGSGSGSGGGSGN